MDQNGQGVWLGVRPDCSGEQKRLVLYAMIIRRSWLVLWCVTVGAFACGGDETAATYHRDIRPLMERNCISCHNDDGIAHFSLEGFANAQAYSDAALVEVEQGRMPPWLPTDDCRSYQAERGLTDAEKRALRSWVEHGTPEGLPEEYVPPEVAPDPREQLGPATLQLGFAEPYTPDAEEHDDYHCFVLDFEQALQSVEGDGYNPDRERYLSMLDVEPGNTDIVHHVIVFLIPEAQSQELDALDAAEAGPGYTCFGGAGIGSAEFLGGWVPGSVPMPWDETSAQRLPPRSRLVMQMHYHTSHGSASDPGTRTHLWLRTERPVNIIDVEPVANLDIEIQPGDTDSRHSIAFPMLGWPGEIVATFPHMHMLGTEIKATAIAAGGASEQCLVDIPRWDFNWQQQYAFLDDQAVSARIGDAIQLECAYDNSPGHQPVVDGEQAEPRLVRWGEGSFDEMCLNFVSVRRPYFEPPDAEQLCGDYSVLYQSCRAYASSMVCAIGAAGASADLAGCLQCVLPELIACLTPRCPLELLALQACVEEHGQLDSLTLCSQEYTKLDSCGGEFLDQGGCNATLQAECGVSLGLSD